MSPEDLYIQDQYVWDEDVIEELMADIRKYLEFWEIAGRTSPALPPAKPYDLYYDPGSGLWVCQLRGGQ
jgi:hypothetical protein